MGQINGSSKGATAVALAFCTALILMLPGVSAKRYIVGGNMGWTSNVNYTLWAGNQTFYLGDWLFFVYDRNQNYVLEVNKTNYETCNAKHPVLNYTTGAGRDVVPLNVTHDRYFISSKGSCYRGMKLHVHLTLLAPQLPLTPSPSPAYHLSPLPSPAYHLSPLPSPIHLTPLPQPPRAAPSNSHSSRFTILVSQLVIPAVVTIAAILDSLFIYV